MKSWTDPIWLYDQANRFMIFQFYRYQEVQAYIEEHFKNGSPFDSEGGVQ
jgi:hypothetical protein